jgi:hypothetical protein
MASGTAIWGIWIPCPGTALTVSARTGIEKESTEIAKQTAHHGKDRKDLTGEKPDIKNPPLYP